MEIYIFTLVAIGIGFFNWRTAKRYEASNARMDEKLDTIHVLVNSKMTVALERISELEKALREERA